MEELHAHQQHWLTQVEQRLPSAQGRYGRAKDVPSPATNRQEVARVALTTLYETEDYIDSLVQLLDNDPVTLAALQERIPALSGGLRPSLDELVAYKDCMRISDQQWALTIKTFNLGGYATISHIRCHRAQLNDTLATLPTGIMHTTVCILINVC